MAWPPPLKIVINCNTLAWPPRPLKWLRNIWTAPNVWCVCAIQNCCSKNLWESKFIQHTSEVWILWYYNMAVCENKIAGKKEDEKEVFDPSTRIFNNFKVKGVQQPRQDQTAHWRTYMVGRGLKSPIHSSARCWKK